MSDLVVVDTSSSSTTTEDSLTTVEKEDNNLAPIALKDVRPRIRRCVCPVVTSDCLTLVKELRSLTKKILNLDPTSGGAVRYTLQNAQIALNELRDHLSNDQLQNVPTLKLKTERLLRVATACKAVDHRRITTTTTI